ncbi:hypothetical protein GCM10022631_34310 [Deinococcus rubellus]|uniref:Uncharacterized protein n=1 Tax=Deinococcus rubellus TaxID=1889240 RepID=A0ABY5YGS8_9DEIO|nr:hypothetical protein [Deinococcus rubellus]UWX63489.1 hypothetical protein N0D28_12155 [Deinococcus rubellus]
MIPDFAPGQRWQYRTRSGEEASRLLILKLEEVEGAQVAHLWIEGLAMKTPQAVYPVLGHAPISIKSLAESVTSLEAEHLPLPSDESSLEEWRTAYKRGEAGMFTWGVAGLARQMERAISAEEIRQMPFQKSILERFRAFFRALKR